ncbi:MAG: hypothetical protein WCQ55_04065 [Paludibacteraceae bacterium]
MLRLILCIAMSLCCCSVCVAGNLSDALLMYKQYGSHTPPVWNELRWSLKKWPKDEPVKSDSLRNDLAEADSMAASIPFSYSKTLLTREVDSLSLRITATESDYRIIPYWMSDVYRNLPDGQMNKSRLGVGYLGYVIDPLSGNSLIDCNLNNGVLRSGDACDLVACCVGQSATNLFLENEDCRRKFIEEVFSYPGGYINHDGICGLNIYFPDFDFSRKKEMVQFVKSISLVIDSFVVADKGLVYGNENCKKSEVEGTRDLNLYFTFNSKACKEHYEFISGLQCFVDGVFFAEYDECGVPTALSYTNGAVDSSSLLARIMNPFYLIRFPYKKIDEEAKADISLLSVCDYDCGRWSFFLFVDVLFFFSIVALCLLYNYHTEFYLCLSRYHTLYMMLYITLSMETLVFFFFLLEALSPQVILFQFRHGSHGYLLWMLLPALPIAICLLQNYLKTNKRIP